MNVIEQVASLAAGTTYGVAKDADVVAVQVLPCKGAASSGKESTAASQNKFLPDREITWGPVSCATYCPVLMNHIASKVWRVADLSMDKENGLPTT